MAKRIIEKPPERIEALRSVQGLVRWDDNKDPVPDVTVDIYVHDHSSEKPIGTGHTDKTGCFGIRLQDEKPGSRNQQDYDVHFIVLDREGQILLSTQETPLRLVGRRWDINLQVPAKARESDRRIRRRPQLQVGPLLMDAEQVAKATPEDVLNIARALRKHRVPEKALQRIEALSPDLIPARLTKRTLSATPIIGAIEALIKLKQWPREVALELDRILQGGAAGYAAKTYDTTNFTITYYDSGTDAVDSDTSQQDVYEPGSNPPTLRATLPAGDPPTYIKRVAYWLEEALNIYVAAPFSMLNPAAAGKIPVYVQNTEYGHANPSAFYIDKDLPADIICAVAVHELFHMVQFQYPQSFPPGSYPWQNSVQEGGAVVAEDAVADLMNRYLDEAGTNFNGIGTQSNPNKSLETVGYKACLFWRYIAEQQSSDITEPLIGVETYRNIVEHCTAGSWSTDDVKAAIRELPWYQDFYEFAYLDAAKQDRTDSETVFGNYVLACYLKDLGTNIPDRRFDFMEDEETIRIDDILQSVITNVPLQTTLASVTLTGTGTVTPSATVAWNGSVNSFASRYYEVAIDPAVTNVNVQFTASSGFASSIFQIALIDEDGKVRDIHRTDLTTYSKRLTSLRDGKRLSKLALVVSGANSSGNFSLSIAAAAAASDVMVTRWHSAVKTEYEIDSFGWAWTWVSPDIWVDNDNDGMADGEVFFNFDNKLHIRLHNKGNADASGVQVEFYYQDASGGLSSGAWLPVQNKAGATQLLTGLSLTAGASKDWAVDWSPSPSGASEHFCVRAVVTAPGDPNIDNKRVLSNFGKVKVKPGGFTDIALLRRHLYPLPKPVTLRIVPRLTHEFQVSLRDLKEIETLVLQPGEVARDLLRLEHRPVGTQIAHARTESKKLYKFATAKRLEKRPDPRGSYKADPRTLPPGVAGKPMLTIVYEVEGHPIGGVTVLVELDKGK